MQLVSTLLYLTVTCSMLVLPEEYLCRSFWEIASIFQYAAFAFFQHCPHVHVGLQKRFGNFKHFCVKVDSAPEVHGGF